MVSVSQDSTSTVWYQTDTIWYQCVIILDLVCGVCPYNCDQCVMVTKYQAHQHLVFCSISDHWHQLGLGSCHWEPAGATSRAAAFQPDTDRRDNIGVRTWISKCLCYIWVFNSSTFSFQTLLVDYFCWILCQYDYCAQCVDYESVVFIDWTIPSDSVPSTTQTAVAGLLLESSSLKEIWW